jgi:imidazolonepropionase-like amidohydrolase
MAVRGLIGLAAWLLAGVSAQAAPIAAVILSAPVAPGARVQPYVRVPAGKVALTHVRVIDGTGAAARENMTVVLDGATIAAIQPAGAAIPAGVKVLDMTGRTVMPGLVGMHDHMYYTARPDADAEGHSEAPNVLPQMTFSAPRLYLAAGVTTLRTTGSVETYADLNVKKQIDAGVLLGPHMDVTGPYLEGPGSSFIQMHQLRDAAETRRFVAFWADQGVTSFKAYMNITREQLGVAIEEAHKLGLKVTGHLCSVTYPEAAALGIDNLEHGFFVNTQNDPGKQPDKCSPGVGNPTLAGMKPGSPEAAALIDILVKHKVALTSTLPVFEQRIAGHAPLEPRVMEAMTPQAREAYLYARNNGVMRPNAAAATGYANDIGLERQFVAAGACSWPARPDRQWRRPAGLRRPARGGTPGRRRLQARGSHQDRHPQRRHLPRPRRPNRLHRPRQARGPDRRDRRPLQAHRRHRKRRDHLQGRRRLRQRQDPEVGARPVRAVLRAGGVKTVAAPRTKAPRD